MKLTRVSDLRSLKLTVTAQMGAVQRQARASRSQDGQHLETSFPSLRRSGWDLPSPCRPLSRNHHLTQTPIALETRSLALHTRTMIWGPDSTCSVRPPDTSDTLAPLDSGPGVWRQTERQLTSAWWLLNCLEVWDSDNGGTWRSRYSQQSADPTHVTCVTPQPFPAPELSWTGHFLWSDHEEWGSQDCKISPCSATSCCVRVSCINNQNSHQSTVSPQRFWISWVVCLSFQILRKKLLWDKILTAFLPGYLITTCTF